MKKIINILILCSLMKAAYAQPVWADEKRIDSLILLMTLEEKIKMIHANGAFSSGGVPRLGIPDFQMTDGPHGVRRELGNYWQYYKTPQATVADSSTYLPVGICLGATWNPELAFRYGVVLGSEANFRKKDVILGPGINIIRTPLNGRNFEYTSEDPFLIASMAVPYIKGVQSQGVSACVKHFAANNQEKDRMKINVLMSERALREIYLPGFEAAVKEGHVNIVMGAYNKFRGQSATHNEYLVNKILKGEWAFDGIMTSDWGAATDTRQALLNGLDVEMGTDIDMAPEPGRYNRYRMADTAIMPLVQSRVVPQSVIDDKVRRVLRVMMRTNTLSQQKIQGAYNTPAHQKVAFDVAAEGIVLLKNKEGVLPLRTQKLKTIAVIGENAIRKNASGGGSSQVKATYEITPLEGIKKMVGTTAEVLYAQGYRVGRHQTKADSLMMKQALALAKSADAVIFIGGWTNKNTDSDRLFLDTETVDKPGIEMPFGQDDLITALLKAQPNTVIALLGGGAIDMSSWQQKAKSILQCWYPGMEGGNALAHIIFGQVNPSGKLPVTFPVRLNDVGAHKLQAYPGDGITVEYKEDIYVGYRYFDTYKIHPAFAFGHGLSYSDFTYSNLKIDSSNGKRMVYLTLKNTGKVYGGEVVQLYVRDEKSTLPRPEKELKGFQKVFLKPGQSQNISFELTSKAFSYYDPGLGSWVLEPGSFEILVGSSSRDLRLRGRTIFY
ncbi:glycoside hydrolase family 3 C-terminal domain-containing protein [Niabella sp. 22666]|uniref:glycoside hydrolase family 3 C-terminal domain-containing protein n=1 Tax=Niabella sp. 22666 TaxID=3453954 RepID=UPI003F84455B